MQTISQLLELMDAARNAGNMAEAKRLFALVQAKYDADRTPPVYIDLTGYMVARLEQRDAKRSRNA